MNLQITNEDCMALMARTPDGYYDLAIVDPPYGYGSVTYMGKERLIGHGGFIDKYEITIAAINNNSRRSNKVEVSHAQKSKTTIDSFADQNVCPPPEYFNELFRVSKQQIIWGGNHFLLPPSRGFVIWHKSTVVESFTMAMAEYAWLSFDANSKVFKGAPQGTKNDPRIHTTQKPVALYRWLLQNYAKPGQRILDTHMGSGSIAIACYDLGFDLTACELDPDYYAAAMKRITTHIATHTMGEDLRPKQVVLNQQKLLF